MLGLMRDTAPKKKRELLKPEHFYRDYQTTTQQLPANSCEFLRNLYRINKIEEDKAIRMSPRLAYLKMVKGGRYNVKN
jgi:hypothetical protein